MSCPFRVAGEHSLFCFAKKESAYGRYCSHFLFASDASERATEEGAQLIGASKLELVTHHVQLNDGISRHLGDFP